MEIKNNWIKTINKHTGRIIIINLDHVEQIDFIVNSMNPKESYTQFMIAGDWIRTENMFIRIIEELGFFKPEEDKNHEVRTDGKSK